MFTPETPNTAEPADAATVRDAAPVPETGSMQYPFRLLPNETVVGTFPLAGVQRPMGRLASYLFVTDSRLVYAAEAKTLSSSSTHAKEFRIDKIEGIEVGRHTGYDALGLVAVVGSALNFLLLLILGLTIGAGTASAAYYGSTNPLQFLQFAMIPFGIASLVIGVVVAIVFRKPRTEIRVLGPDKSHTLAQQLDLPALLVLLLLIVVFGLFLGLALLAWVAIRELGVFRATDAEGFAPPQNVDRVSYEAGTLILDVQARGAMAGQY
ncbi:hypothetical protein [Microbacterium sp. NPDC057650]|uniref:hypothetical protein n=1 Tax=unclassified Microbacterium TaxID=2609290 RepID=UPI003671E15B